MTPTPPTEPTPACDFDRSWVGPCKKPTVDGGTKCQEHAGLKCAGCGKDATRDCEHTGQFVCGAPLCGDCAHLPPSLDSLNWFGMAGGHGPSSKASEAWEAHWAKWEAERLLAEAANLRQRANELEAKAGLSTPEAPNE